MFFHGSVFEMPNHLDDKKTYNQRRHIPYSRCGSGGIVRVISNTTRFESPAHLPCECESIIAELPRGSEAWEQIVHVLDHLDPGDPGYGEYLPWSLVWALGYVWHSDLMITRDNLVHLLLDHSDLRRAPRWHPDRIIREIDALILYWSSRPRSPGGRVHRSGGAE